MSRYIFEPTPIVTSGGSATEVIPITNGGTNATTAAQAVINLGGLAISSIGQPNGLAPYTNAGLDAAYISGGFVSTDTIMGLTSLTYGQKTTYSITNLDVFKTYQLADISGTLGVTGGLGGDSILSGGIGGIDFTAPTSGTTASFSINGRVITIPLSSGSLPPDGSVISGGLIIPPGTTATNLHVASGGTVTVSGTVSGTTVDSGGTLHVVSGGHDVGTTVKGGGTDIVDSGGTETSATIQNLGTKIVHSGGIVEHLVVNIGGAVDLQGIPMSAVTFTPIHATVTSGGTLTIDVLPGPGATLVESADSPNVGTTIIGVGAATEQVVTPVMTLTNTTTGFTVTGNAFSDNIAGTTLKTMTITYTPTGSSTPVVVPVTVTAGATFGIGSVTTLHSGDSGTVTITYTSSNNVTSQASISGSYLVSAVTPGWSNATYNGTYYLQVATDGTNKVRYSQDLNTWQQVTVPTPAGGGNWKFIASISNTGLSIIINNTAIVAYSSNGLSWNLSTTLATGITAVNSIAAKLTATANDTDAVFLAVCGGSYIYSTNGLAWTKIDISTWSTKVDRVIWAYRGGSEFTIFDSSTGNIGQIATALPSVIGGTGVSPGSGNFMYAGNAGSWNYALNSTGMKYIVNNGLAWTSMSLSPNSLVPKLMETAHSIGTSGNIGTVVTATTAFSNYISDASITTVPSSSLLVNGTMPFVADTLTPSNDRVIATTYAGQVAVTMDGYHWSTTAAAVSTWSNATYNGTYYLQVATDGTNKVRYSQDLNTWQSVTVPTPASGGNWKFIASTPNGLSTILNNTGIIAYATNPTGTWSLSSPVTLPTGVTSIASVYDVASNLGAGGTTAPTSFMAVCDTVFIYSTDGNTWTGSTYVASPSFKPTCVSWREDEFVQYGPSNGGFAQYGPTNPITPQGLGLATSGSTWTSSAGSKSWTYVISPTAKQVAYVKYDGSGWSFINMTPATLVPNLIVAVPQLPSGTTTISPGVVITTTTTNSAFTDDVVFLTTSHFTYGTMPFIADTLTGCKDRAIATTYAGQVAVTLDGYHWSTLITAVSTWSNVTYNGTYYVAVATDGSNVTSYSTTGLPGSWTRGTIPAPASGVWKLVSGCKLGLIVAISTTGACAYTYDPSSHWTLATTNVTGITLVYALSSNPNADGTQISFVALCNISTCVIHTTDGVTWSSTTTGLSLPSGTTELSWWGSSAWIAFKPSANNFGFITTSGVINGTSISTAGTTAGPMAATGEYTYVIDTSYNKIESAGGGSFVWVYTPPAGITLSTIAGYSTGIVALDTNNNVYYSTGPTALTTWTPVVLPSISGTYTVLSSSTDRVAASTVDGHVTITTNGTTWSAVATL